MTSFGNASAGAEKLGFVGLGLMGLPMTHRLLAAGHSVAVWNRSAAKAAALLEAGATRAICPREIATGAGRMVQGIIPHQWDILRPC